MNSTLKKLRTALSEQYLKFVPATKEVLHGEIILTEKDSKDLGSIYLSVGAFHKPDPARLRTGITIAEGAKETYQNGVLRCYRTAAGPCVRAFDRKKRALSMELQLGHGADPNATAWDEGFFTWFGTVDSIQHAWSDNDPDHCQVVTIEDLRELLGA